LRQMGLADAQRGLALEFRVGALSRGPEDASAISIGSSFNGNGLRPYPVAHLRAQRQSDGTIRATWIRRSRRGGDSWQSLEVPLAEDSEQYTVEVVMLGVVLRRVTTRDAVWDYTSAMRAADAALAPYVIRVAQISQAFGPGPYREVTISA
jgi:hypothetical protein